MKIIVIGGIAAGMSMAAKAARENPEADITVIEKENYISFGACGLPYYLGGQFENSSSMFARTVDQMENTGINFLLNTEVTKIDYGSKKVLLTDLIEDEKLEISYDRLMIASGASPILPPIDGIDSQNVFTFTRLQAVEEIKSQLDSINSVAVIGGGFIGIEVAEQLAHVGKEVTLIESGQSLMNGSFDIEFGKKMQEALEKSGVTVYTGQTVTALKTANHRVTQVMTERLQIDTDLVVVAIGFRPNTSFAKDEQLEMLDNGAISVDRYGETSIKDVYAAGDAASVYHRQLGNTYLPLATYANKLGRLIGTNIVVDREDRLEYVGALGTGAIKVGDYEAGRTGLTEFEAKTHGYNFKTTTIQASNHTGYWPNRTPVEIKLVYEADTKVLLGAQVFGQQDAVTRLTGLTAAVHAEMTTDELGFVDFAYAPPFATTWEAINIAANTAK